MNMEEKDRMPSNDSIDSGSIDGQHMKKAENNVGDQEAGLSSAEKATTKDFSRLLRKVAILASLCLVTVLPFIALSVLAPFYPQEAQARGVSTSLVGLIFGTYSLMGFIFAPFSGIMVSKYGSVSVLYIGMLLCGTAMILFGFFGWPFVRELVPVFGLPLSFVFFCAWVSATTDFVVLSFLFRTLGAFGGIACQTSAMSIAIEEFPQRLAMASGFIETSVGVGLSLGPVLGGSLYTAGGFPLPFFVIGCSTIVAIPILCCVFSSDCEFQSRKSTGQEEGLFPIVKALKIPAVSMIAVCFATTGLVQVYFEPILGPHLENTMNLNSTQIGLVFLVYAMTYAVVAPPAGWIGDRTQCYRLFTVAGYTGVGFGFFLLGPAPFLTFFLPSKRVWLVCVAMAIIGFSLGVFFVQLMPDLVAVTRDKGMPDNSATRGVISGIYSGMLSLGAFIGPTLGGIFDQHIGFQWAIVVVGIISFAQALILVAFTLWERTVDSRRKEQYSPIMDNSSEEEEELVMDSSYG